MIIFDLCCRWHRATAECGGDGVLGEVEDANRGSSSGHLDNVGSSRRRRYRVAVLTQGFQVQGNGLGNVGQHLLLCPACSYTPREVRDVGRGCRPPARSQLRSGSSVPPTCLASDRSQGTRGQVVTQVARDGDRSRALRMTVLTVAPDLAVEAPPLTLRPADDLPDLHRSRTRPIS